jgi:hypothetical protein
MPKNGIIKTQYPESSRLGPLDPQFGNLGFGGFCSRVSPFHHLNQGYSGTNQTGTLKRPMKPPKKSLSNFHTIGTLHTPRSIPYTLPPFQGVILRNKWSLQRFEYCEQERRIRSMEMMQNAGKCQSQQAKSTKFEQLGSAQ